MNARKDWIWGAIMVIVCDQAKSGATHEELYRTGNVFGLTENWAKRCFKDEILETVLKKRVMIMDYKDAIAIGLPVKNYPR